MYTFNKRLSYIHKLSRMNAYKTYINNDSNKLFIIKIYYILIYSL